MISLSEKIIIILILISSQVFPGNILYLATAFSILSLIILTFYYVDLKNSKIPLPLIGIITFTIFILSFQYQEISSFIRQLMRILFPWLLLFIYHLLIVKNTQNVHKLYEIVKFTSLGILLILIPDFLSLIYNFFNNFGYLIILKLSSVSYRETNTSAFLLLYTIIFRNENKLASLKENIITVSGLFLTFSRSSILFFFIYIFY